MSLEDIGGANSFTSKAFPPQKVPLSKKGKKWQEQCVNYVIKSSTAYQHFSSNPTRIHDIWENENLVEGIYDEKELAYITEPFGVKDKLPARLKEYNLIKPLISSLVGEEINRPFSFSVMRTSENAKNERTELMKKELDEYITQAILSNISPDQAEEFHQAMQSGQIQPPEDLARHMQETYKDIAEEFCQTLVDSEVHKLDMRTEFVRGYEDYLKHGEEIFFVGEEYGHVNVRRVIPSTFYYEFTPNLVFIDDASWCAERMVLSYSDFYDRYSHEIEEKDLDKILDRLQDSNGGEKGAGEHTYAPDWFNVPQPDPNNPFSTTTTTIEVWKVHWKSFRKVYFVTVNNPQTNQPETKVMDENYVKTGDEESVEEDWIMQVWQGHRVRKDIYFGVRPVNIASDMNDPTSIKLPYTGIASHSKSIVELLRPMQITYLSLWYRVELLLARDNGQVLVMDATQIPKSLGFDPPTWAHYMKATGVALVNPYESGWGVPGRDGGRASGFTAFQSLNLSTGQAIQQYIQLIDKVEGMAMQIIGFTPQRMGNVGHRDLAGTTQQALNESYNTTAMIVYMHDRVKERVLRKMLNTALAIRWRDNDDYLSFLGTDGMRMFLKMPHTAIETMDLRVVDSQEEAKKMQAMQQLYQPAMQNGATLADVAKMLTSHNTNEIRLLLEDVERRKQQMQQQQEQQQQQIQQMQMQQVEMDRQHQVDKENADRQLKKYQIDIEAQMKKEEITLKVEELMKEEPEEKPDPIELEKIELEKNKLENEFELKSQEMNLKAESDSQKFEVEHERIEVERSKIEENLALDRRAQYEKHQEAEEKLKLENKKLQAEISSSRREAVEEVKRMKLEHSQELEKIKIETQKLINLEKEKVAAQAAKELSILKQQLKADKEALNKEITSKEKIEKLKSIDKGKEIKSKEKIEQIRAVLQKTAHDKDIKLREKELKHEGDKQKKEIRSKEGMHSKDLKAKQTSEKSKASESKAKSDQASKNSKNETVKDVKIEKLKNELEDTKKKIDELTKEQEERPTSLFFPLF